MLNNSELGHQKKHIARFQVKSPKILATHNKYSMAQICIESLNVHLKTSKDETLLTSLKRAKVSLEAVCGGKGYCGTCSVRINSGSQQLSPVTTQEISTLNNLNQSPEDYRLSCQVKVDDGEEVSCQPPTEALVKLTQIFSRLKDRCSPRDIKHPITGELLVRAGGVVTHNVLERLLSS
ncbi:ferredoxin [[Leptolyngbya] sp. PCC 7376]|nr:ferredoxin [[Leptolyngbya] sp. PCC 7376]